MHIECVPGNMISSLEMVQNFETGKHQRELTHSLP